MAEPATDREKEIARLEEKLAASKSMGGGYADRIAAIEAELERLRASDA